MNTKTIMTLAVAGALATAAFADEAFDQLLALSRTPATSFTKANAASILDACIATTNRTTAFRLVESKLLTFGEIFAKTKGNKLFLSTIKKAAIELGTEAEYAEAFNDFVDTWITLDAEDEAQLAINIANYCVPSWKDKKFIDAGLAKSAAAKIASSNAPLKWNGIALIVYIYPGSVYFYGRLDAEGETYKDQVKASILNGEFYPNFQYIDFINYLRDVAKDSDAARSLVGDVKWFKSYAKAKSNCPFLSKPSCKDLEPNLSAVRKEYLKIAENDFQLMTVAKAQDKVDGDKKTTESIYAKLVEPKNKIDAALYLNDNDKLVEALIATDNLLDAETINKAITIINALDPDWRAADVLKALRVINKKYTLKLYDDRDTWEPILSKVRALIDTYNN